jgi:hypothetical protein
LLDPHNRWVDQGGFGNYRRLDEAKYWRAIELGSSDFVSGSLASGASH